MFYLSCENQKMVSNLALRSVKLIIWLLYKLRHTYTYLSIGLCFPLYCTFFASNYIALNMFNFQKNISPKYTLLNKPLLTRVNWSLLSGLIMHIHAYYKDDKYVYTSDNINLRQVYLICLWYQYRQSLKQLMSQMIKEHIVHGFLFYKDYKMFYLYHSFTIITFILCK